jgi:hypothetical protein
VATAGCELLKPVTSRRESQPLEKGALLPNIKLAEWVMAEPGVRVVPIWNLTRIDSQGHADTVPTCHVSTLWQVVLLSEIEPYRVYDPAASRHHIQQTAHIPPCHLTFVSQGQGGALSLVLVGLLACQKNPRKPSATLSPMHGPTPGTPSSRRWRRG